ncbi:hypothetical protein ADK67_13790 [Saccharothrix sp. NRRL B-16348]|uniref:hypothetical protein n=1 Tax=Saccharothrix sp. NRRL B-16348 TaxID=1415542 RepID=UPI0006AF138B|nr:hypothetical protein [Saccharothrix sp. NRRL B-16348]KOX27507.1 hypothetical protein ADK67_13790 [Saccharothrix sp. NRRL B-16348]
MAARDMDRRAVLRHAGAAGAVGALSALFGNVPAMGQPSTTPFDLHFAVAHKHRPFDLVAPRFVQYDSAITPPPATSTTLVRTGVRPRAPFGSVLVEVQRAEGVVVAGLAGGGTSVLGTLDAAAGKAAIEVTTGGVTTVVKSADVRVTGAFRFAVVVNENAVTVLVDTTGAGMGWQPVLTERDGVRALVDLRVPAVLGGLDYAYGGRGDVRLGRVRAGYFGQAGVRDPHVVQHADGRPYIRDGKLYVTMTNAGLGFFQQAHWAVWTIDLADPAKLEQVAILFFERDGVVLGDHAGQIVYDDRTGRFILLMSSWGDFAFRGVHIRHTATTANVLRGVHVLRTERLPLPTSVSSWDPALTRVDGRWRLAFVESEAQQPAFVFHPALAVAAPGADYTDTRLVGADTSVDQTEGTIIQRVGREWYLFASDGDARQYPVYDLAMRKLGTLDAPYGTNIPHPMLLPVGREWWLITFDGTQYAEPVLGYGGHGDLIVMRSPAPGRG